MKAHKYRPYAFTHENALISMHTITAAQYQCRAYGIYICTYRKPQATHAHTQSMGVWTIPCGVPPALWLPAMANCGIGRCHKAPPPALAVYKTLWITKTLKAHFTFHQMV
jgi:hypothetical protein